MRRDVPFAIGETYHLYNRGAHKQDIFTCERDYQRFVTLLYLANSVYPVNVRETLRKFKGQTFERVFEEERGEPLIYIRAYCLMPNHFHLVIEERSEKGITTFMRKLLTGYSMYFNTLYDHSGILSQGTVKSRHIDNEPYYRYIFSYVHLNPLALCLPGWEEQGIANPVTAQKFLEQYQYSSFYDYSVGSRPGRSILETHDMPDFLHTQNDLMELIRWQEPFKGLTFENVLK